MAIRINVTAVWGCHADEVRAVFTDVLGPQFAGVTINEHGGWVWFSTSVWGVSGGDLNRGLCRLARSALQFTTSDGDRWYLTVHGGCQGQVHFLHEFGYHSHPAVAEQDAEAAAALEQQPEPPPADPRLAFLEEDPVPGPTRPRAPFDLVADALAGVGGPVPEAFRTSVVDLTYSQALNRYQEWHAEQIILALAAAGIPHDPAAVRSVLLWQNVTEVERDNDLGNLPRLLSVLGLGGEWDEWVRQAETPPPPPQPQPAPQPPAPPPDQIRPVLGIVDPLGLTPVVGGVVPLALKVMALVRFFIEACSTYETAGVVLTVSLPAGFDRPHRIAGGGDGAGQVEMMSDGFRVGLPNHLWFGRRDLHRTLGKELGRLLFELPDGTVLDCAFATEGKPALSQRYRGSVTGKIWHIDATYPPLTREALADALALAAKSDQSHFRARDEAEAEAILDAARVDPNLCDSKVDRKGLVVGCKSDVTGNLAKLFFRHRFRAYWDVAAAQRGAQEQYSKQQEMKRKMREVGAEAARRRAAPHEDDVLLEGKHSRFWRSDFAQLTELEQESRQKIDQALDARGFRHVADLVAKKQRDIVMRTYVGPDGLCYGILLAKRTMYLGYEFFSRFADGSMLVTTTNAAVASQPEAGLYYKKCPGLEAAALYEKHVWGIGRFRSRKGTEPVPLETTLLGTARELDEALARRATVS